MSVNGLRDASWLKFVVRLLALDPEERLKKVTVISAMGAAYPSALHGGSPTTGRCPVKSRLRFVFSKTVAQSKQPGKILLSTDFR